jgi:hypothetical protein
LIRENITWEVWYGNTMEICKYDKINQYFFKGDSIIDNKIYKKIYHYHVISKIKTPYCPPYFVDNSQFFLDAFIREDTVERKVYIYDEEDNKEGILYDFNLKKGDTITYKYATKGMKVIVDSVGLIKLKDNQIRKKTYLSNHQFYIEGIGGSAGVQFPYIQYLGFWTALSCYRENSKEIFLKDDCIPYLLASKDIENQAVINILPNPFVNNLSINIENDETMEFKLYDIFSKNILQKSFQNAVLLDTSTLPNGTYFYQLSSKKGISKVGKLLKTE